MKAVFSYFERYFMNTSLLEKEVKKGTEHFKGTGQSFIINMSSLSQPSEP
jgi:hypothetical protein